MRNSHASAPTSIWNSAFIRIFIFATLTQLTMSITNTVLPLFVINDLGYSNTQSGLLGTVFTIGSMACRFIAGRITDRFGRRIIMAVSASTIGAALFLMGLSPVFTAILILKTLQGIAHALQSTASTAAAADNLPPARLSEGIGYFSLHSSVINAIGPTVSLLLMTIAVAPGAASNYQLPLYIGGTAGIIAAIIAVFLKYGASDNAYKRDDSTRIHLSDFIEPRSLRPAILQCFNSFVFGAGVFMIVFASDMGFASVNYYYIISGVTVFITRLAMGRRMDSVRPEAVSVAGALLLAISYVFLGLAMNETAYIASAILSGASSGLLSPTLNSLCLKLAPAKRSGSASTTYWLGFDIGMALGQIAFGAVIDAGGFSAAFISAGAFMLLFAALAFILLRKLPALKDIHQPDQE